ncbi:MAG: GNAT family N-acetyltransferase [Anaerolineaceae bacterium]|nr:GNAT family N-acetyltransferase [Anaerolineaceae bacterium]
MSKSEIQASPLFRFEEGKEIPLEALMGLYESVEWKAYTRDPALMALILPNSLYYRSAWAGENLAGLIRVVGDGLSIIYIQDLLINPRYQSQKLGKNLLVHVIEKYSHVRQIVLITDNLEKNRKFYEACGLRQAEVYGVSAYVRFIL